MAFEADCGLSTVLEAFRVARTIGSLVPGESWVTCHAWPRPQKEVDEICGLEKPTTHVPWDSVRRRRGMGWRSGRRS